MMTEAKPTIHWKTEWDNGTPTHIVTFSDAWESHRGDIERSAEQEGFRIDGDRWSVPEGATAHGLFEVARAMGFDVDFGQDEGDDARFNLQRLKLEPENREKLETLPNFTLGEFAGYCPVQAQGELDGQYWYFRARGTEWRLQAGGTDDGTLQPVWWHAEYWPSDDGFGAGYLTDEEAITCILKAVEIFRTEDHGRFEKGHPAYERTILEGWAMGAISFEYAVGLLGISGDETIERAKAFEIDLPFYARQELGTPDRPRSQEESDHG